MPEALEERRAMPDRASQLRVILFGSRPGLATAVGPWLIALVGIGFIWLGLSDVTQALRTHPADGTCAEFLAHPDQGPRWVRLTGCRIDLPAAATRRWTGWWPSRDGGATGKTLELFIPLSAIGQPLAEPPQAVVATTDKRLLELVDEVQRLETFEKVDAFIIEHQAELESTLAPQYLTGYIESVPSSASNTALGVMTAPNAVVLEQGREPQRLNSVCMLLFGLAVALWGLMPVIRRARGIDAW